MRFRFPQCIPQRSALNPHATQPGREHLAVEVPGHPQRLADFQLNCLAALRQRRFLDQRVAEVAPRLIGLDSPQTAKGGQQIKFGFRRGERPFGPKSNMAIAECPCTNGGNNATYDCNFREATPTLRGTSGDSD